MTLDAWLEYIGQPLMAEHNIQKYLFPSNHGKTLMEFKILKNVLTFLENQWSEELEVRIGIL